MYERLRPDYFLGMLPRLAIIALLLALTACGGEEAATLAPPVDPAAALAAATERLREAGTLSFEAEFVETKQASPDEHTTYMTVEGALDLAAGEGRTVVDLTWLGRELEQLRKPGETADPALDALFGAPVEVRWDESSAYVRVGDRWQRAPREQLRTGILGTTAEELDNLIRLLPLAEDARIEGTAAVDGEPTTHVVFTVPARRAGAQRVPAELYGAYERALHGPQLRLEAWLDADGLPRRLAYSVSKDAVESEGKVVIPAKSIRVTYDLAEFGEDVDSAPPN
jgi:hypothetical protein